MYFSNYMNYVLCTSSKNQAFLVCSNCLDICLLSIKTIQNLNFIFVSALKQLIHLAGQNFSCHKAHCFKLKLVLHVAQAIQIDASCSTVNSRLKNTQGISVESMECL